MDQDQKRIEILYQLLDRAEREKDEQAASALRWAIFSLERIRKVVTNNFN